MSSLGYIIVILALIGLNIFTIWFYHRHLNVLIDKTMSNSYPEYVHTKNLEHAEHFPNISTQEKLVVEDDQVLQELNSILR